MISYLGSLVQFSPATGRTGCCRQISLCVDSTQCSGHTGFAPHRGVCAFPVYTAQAPACSIWSGPCVECGSSFRVLHKSADSVALAFCAFPGRAAQAARSLTGALSPVRCAFSPVRCAFSPPRPQPQLPRALVGCLRLVCVLGSWPLAATLPVHVDHPESQEVFGGKLEARFQFGRGAVTEAEFAEGKGFPSPLPPASSGDGPVGRLAPL